MESQAALLSRRKFLGLGSLAFLDAALHPAEALGARARTHKPAAAPTPATEATVQKKLKATAALLVDAKTGQILFEKGTDLPLPPASTTKMMMALVVYEKIGLEGKVRIEKGDLIEQDHIHLKAGDEVSVKDLMYAALVCSANNAARALARHVGGSIPAFLDLMNARAKELGCEKSHFSTPNGMPAPGIQTTARDLLKIFEKVDSIPALREIMRTSSYKMESHKGVEIHNHNKLLGVYPGMDAAKTGWYRYGPYGRFDAAHGALHTFAASAIRDGRELHLILLHSANKWADAPMLFDYGFAQKPRPTGNFQRALLTPASGAEIKPPLLPQR